MQFTPIRQNLPVELHLRGAGPLTFGSRWEKGALQCKTRKRRIRGPARRRWLDADCDEPMIYKVNGNKSSAASANTPGLLIFRYPQIGAPRVVIAEGCNSPWFASRLRALERSASYKSKEWILKRRRCGDPRPSEARSRYPFPVAIRISERSWKIFANTVIFAALENAARIWVSILNFSPRRSHAISGYL